MAGTDDRFRAPPELVVAALIAAGSLPLARLFRTGGIVPTILFSIAVSATGAWGLRRLRVYAPLAALVSGAAWFWFAGLAFFRDTLLGPLPTPATFAEAARAIGEGIGVATTEVAPVESLPELLALVSMIVWGLAWLADDAVHKLRHPLLAIGFVLPVFIFPGTLVESPRRWLDAGLFIAAALAVLFADETSRLARWGRTAGLGSPGWKPGLALRIGTFVTLASIVSAPVVPGYGAVREDGGGGAGGGDRVALNPLVSIKPRLTRNPATPLFTVRSAVPAYWRLTALDIFNGFTWTAPQRGASRVVSGRTVPPSAPAEATRQVAQSFVLERLAGPWLPGAYEAMRVDRRGSVRLEPVTRSLVATNDLRPGDRFQVTSRVPTPTAEQLDEVEASQMSDRSLAPYLVYPQASVPASVVSLARQLTDGEPTPFRKAVALQQFLREFTYDENVAARHDYSTLEQFLMETRRGYCEQFSASMAVMARIVGIPSRVAIGFAVGEPVGADTYRVTSRHAHAWVELFFPGYGWLPFEPTPRTDATLVPEYTQATSIAPPPGAIPTITASPSPTASPTDGVDPRNLEGEDELGAGARPASAARRVVVPLLVMAGALAIAALLLPGAAALKQRRRRRRARDARSLAAAHYMDFLDWCAAAGFPRRAGETPAEYARRLAEAAAPAERPLAELASVTTRALWAPAGGSALPDETLRLGRAAQRAIAGTLPAWARARPLIGWGWWRRG